ncbi:SRPBCC family protein [Xinfangfangia sp. CPCC 101601]|uniref:SRPBCC family protein n=1 Tax=Pseudogemmobacter lacusdianii TaxID=3069608 RepID=A0ABU0W0N3_9RHOB|nr:SRPBCC family protein [Xinfangfangia sp. CPCC 101601]MDQ2067580.1 SRPBCC family protein [Xinfangfangia sp. CPCC 101601]
MNLHAFDLDPQTDLSFTRSLAVPRALIWECWTEPRHIPHFFIPKPHKITAVDIDLCVGGRFNTSFDVDGHVMDNKGVYLEVVPGEKLVFTDSYTEGWKPAADPFMTAILLLQDGADGGTTYTAIARHRSPDARASHEKMGFYDGWGTVASQLETYAKGLQG